MIKKILLFSLVFISLKAAEFEVRIGTQASIAIKSLALAAGFVDEEFSKIGAKVKIVEFDSGREMNAAFAAKSIDFGGLGLTPFVIAAVNDLDLALVWIDSRSLESEGLAARKGKFKSFEDIKGAKIAVSFGTSSHFALLQALKINKISPKEVKLIDIPAASIESAWNRNDVDLAFIWSPYLSNLKDKVLLYTDKNLADKGIFIAEGIAVRKEFAKKYPDSIKAYKAALSRAYALYEKDRAKAIKIIAKYYHLDEKLVADLIDAKNKKMFSAKDQESEQLFGTAIKVGQIIEQLVLIADFLKEQNLLRKVPSKDKFKEFILY